MSIDPRLIERRKTVAEDHAKRNVGRLLKFLASIFVVGGLVWATFSPWLSVSRVDVTGNVSSDVYTILADNNVVAGTPMIRISASGTQRALLEDPWIAGATVDLHWPDRVTVELVERVPVAWSNTESGWTRRAIDGVALPSPETPDTEAVHIEMPELADVATSTSPDFLGALEFAAALAPDLRPGAVVTTVDDELWATVSGYQVRLGRGVEMASKARGLEALLAEALPEGSVVVMIAPTNPSVLTPQGAAAAAQQAEGEETPETGAGEVTEDDG